MDKAQNVLSNVVLADDPRRLRLVGGTLQIVIIEAAISKVIRKVLGKDNTAFLDLLLIHALSLPLMGGAAGFMDANGAYSEDYMSLFRDGVKGVLAVFLGQYALGTFKTGFHIPSITAYDAFITAASKILTRPLIGTAFGSLPDAMQKSLNDVEEMINRQRTVSNLNQK